jgi:hypothetical protein
VREAMTPQLGSEERRALDARAGALPGGDVTGDEMGEASFPASDSPATWTWEVPAGPADPDDSGASAGSSAPERR